MDSRSNPNDISHDFPPFFKAYKDGHIERYVVSDPVPPTADPTAAIQSKNAVISPDSGIVARIFFSKTEGAADDQKLPLLLHFHGGGFCIGSALDAITRDHLTTLVAEANAIAVSVEYRLAPEHPLPTAYDDCFAALQWVAAHAGGCGPEPILNSRADLGRVFMAGESAGANIAHSVAVRAGVSPPAGVNIAGLVLVHPFFGGKGCDEMYKYLCPSSSGCGDDLNLNPVVDPNLRSMCCRRVLVCVAENDGLRDRGEAYYETLRNSEWVGTVELEKDEGVDHCFHMFDPTGEKAMALIKRIAIFINRV